MPTIDVTPKIKERLKDVKKELDCKTYSDVINMLLYRYEIKKI